MFIEHCVRITPKLKSSHIFDVNITYCLEVKLPLLNRSDFQNMDLICNISSFSSSFTNDHAVDAYPTVTFEMFDDPMGLNWQNSYNLNIQ